MLLLVSTLRRLQGVCKIVNDNFQLLVPNGDTVPVYMWEKIKHSHHDVMERKEILTKDLVKKNLLQGGT